MPQESKVMSLTLRPLLVVPVALLLLAPFLIAACGGEGTPTEELTIYSAREENLVGSIIKQFGDATGVDVGVKYGSNAGLAATIREEGSNSTADIFFATDPGLLGAMSDLFTVLPNDILDQVAVQFRSREGKWVGISGRARVIVYNAEKLNEADLPDSIFDLTDPKWKGRIGWPPGNGSFQAFVTAMRVKLGDDVTREWLEGIQRNDPKVYPKNTPIVQAVADGEVTSVLSITTTYHGSSKRKASHFPPAITIREAKTWRLMLVNGAGISLHIQKR